jgi:hypothetical protein
MEDLFPCLAEIIDKCNMSEIDIFAPKEKIRPEDRVVGELPDRLKKLFAANKRLFEDVDELEYQAKSDCSLRVKFVRQRSLLEIFNNVLWHEITDNFELWNYEGMVVGLRFGWKVVVFSDRRQKAVCEGQKMVRNSIDLPLIPNFFLFFSRDQKNPPTAM